MFKHLCIDTDYSVCYSHLHHRLMDNRLLSITKYLIREMHVNEKEYIQTIAKACQMNQWDLFAGAGMYKGKPITYDLPQT